MTSQPFHLKYRPKHLDDVVGQRDVVRSLKTVMEDRAVRAYIFTGPSGTGKTTLSRIVSAGLGCEDRNLVEIDAATHTGVDAWRGITANLAFAPIGVSSVRCIIVDEAHMLSKAAWNSLLKDIEEPPPGVFWFICTTEKGKIPRTIQTRCVSYDLKPVSSSDLQDLIEYVCEQEGGGPPEKVLGMIARTADGSPREALTMLAACWAAKGPKAAAKLLQTSEDSSDVVAVCRAIIKGSKWSRIVPLLKELQGQNPEGLRLTCLAYFTKVALGSRTEQASMNALSILSAFVDPYPRAPAWRPSCCLSQTRSWGTDGSSDSDKPAGRPLLD